MRRILRPFPWALLGHLCLGIVLAPLLAILLGLTAVALPLAVFTPRPFLSLVRDLGSLAGLDRARFDVLARRHVGQPLARPADGVDAHDRVRWVLAEPRHRALGGYTVARLRPSAMDASRSRSRGVSRATWTSRSTGSADARRAARQAGGCGGGMTPIWRIAPTSSRTPQCSASRSPSVR